MAAGEPDEGFKVTDRRRRGDEDAPPTASPTREATPPRAARPEPPPRPGPAPSPSREAPAAAERNLVGLFMMLASSALMALGEVADAATGQRQRDLPGAAEVIDVLLLLRDKTEGHRSPEESQVLDELLYDLQLRYVNATKRPG
jgi:Domain of unknown function (DUF1844)